MNLWCSWSFLVIGHSPLIVWLSLLSAVLSGFSVYLSKKEVPPGTGETLCIKHTLDKRDGSTRLLLYRLTYIYGQSISVLADLSVHKLTTFNFNIRIEIIRLFAPASLFSYSISTTQGSVKASTLTFEINFLHACVRQTIEGKCQYI